MVSRPNRSNQGENYDAVEQDIEADLNDELDEELGSVDLGEVEDLETELGMQEVYLDEAEIDAIPVDDDEYFDTDADGIEDDFEGGPVIDDRPQELTESYGTGLQGKPSDRSGRYSRWSENHLENNPDAVLTGGDVDANYEQAGVVGDEAVGGTVATPDQDVVEELAAAVGITMDDRSFLRTNDMLEQRDDRRWELEPESSEDYSNRGE